MNTASNTLFLLLVWTIGTVILASLVGLAMRHTHRIYIADEDEVVEKPSSIERCTWQRLYGVSLVVTGVGLILSHSLIDNCTARNISLGWGIVISMLGAGLWMSYHIRTKN